MFEGNQAKEQRREARSRPEESKKSSILIGVNSYTVGSIKHSPTFKKRCTLIVHQIHAVILQKEASLLPAKSGSFSPKSGSFLSFFARPRAIALGSKPLAGSSVRSHSACRPGDEAESNPRLHVLETP